MARSSYQDDLRASLADLAGGSARERLARLGERPQPAAETAPDPAAHAPDRASDRADVRTPDRTSDRTGDRTHETVRTGDRTPDRADVRTHDRTDTRTGTLTHDRTDARPDVHSDTRTHDRTLDHSLDRTHDRTDYRTLTAKQRDVLCYLYGLGSALVMCREVAEATGLRSDEAARGQIKQLARKGLLRYSRGRAGALQGLHCELTEAGATLARSIPRSLDRSHDRTNDRSNTQTPDRSHDRTPTGQETGQETGQTPLLEERKKDFLTALEKMPPQDYAAFWPGLEGIGLTVAKAREIARKRLAADRSLDQLQAGLDHADAAVAMGLDKMAGKPVDRPLAYVYAPLLRDGYFDRPPGWLTPEERAAQDAEAKATAARQARERMEAAWMDAWLAGLDPAQEHTILAAAPGLKDISRISPETRARVLRLEWIRLGRPQG